MKTNVAIFILLLCACSLLLTISMPVAAQTNHKTAEQIKHEIDSINKATDRRMDSIRNARLQEVAANKEDDNARLQKALQQSKDNLAAIEEQREEKAGTKYKWIAIIGRYIIMFGILSLIAWWKKRQDKKKQTTGTTEKSSE